MVRKITPGDRFRQELMGAVSGSRESFCVRLTNPVFAPWRGRSMMGLACSPKVDPVVVRVSTAREPGKEAQDERQATHPGPDHRQAA